MNVLANVMFQNWRRSLCSETRRLPTGWMRSSRLQADGQVSIPDSVRSDLSHNMSRSCERNRSRKIHWRFSCWLKYLMAKWHISSAKLSSCCACHRVCSAEAKYFIVLRTWKEHYSTVLILPLCNSPFSCSLASRHPNDVLYIPKIQHQTSYGTKEAKNKKDKSNRTTKKVQEGNQFSR